MKARVTTVAVVVGLLSHAVPATQEDTRGMVITGGRGLRARGRRRFRTRWS